jgi:hypothetical protein
MFSYGKPNLKKWYNYKWQVVLGIRKVRNALC